MSIRFDDPACLLFHERATIALGKTSELLGHRLKLANVGLDRRLGHLFSG
jgi:hypothetical protein